MAQEKVGLKEWQLRQKQQQQEWEADEEKYGECARTLHRMYKSLLMPKSFTSKMLQHYSLKTSSSWPHMVKAARIVLDNEFDPKKYLVAQFEFFSKYYGTIPKPNQLHTSNAIDRFNDYMAVREQALQTEKLLCIAPKKSTKTRERDHRKHWDERIAALSRPPGASDRDALIAHCIAMPAEVLIEYGVWDQVKARWEKAHA